MEKQNQNLFQIGEQIKFKNEDAKGYYDSYGTEPSINFNEFGEKYGVEEFTLGRVAIKDAQGRVIENITTENVSIEELKAKYPEEQGYTYTVNINAKGKDGTEYKDLGWIALEEIMEKEERENEEQEQEEIPEEEVPEEEVPEEEVPEEEVPEEPIKQESTLPKYNSEEYDKDTQEFVEGAEKFLTACHRNIENNTVSQHDLRPSLIKSNDRYRFLMREEGKNFFKITSTKVYDILEENPNLTVNEIVSQLYSDKSTKYTQDEVNNMYEAVRVMKFTYARGLHKEDQNETTLNERIRQRISDDYDFIEMGDYDKTITENKEKYKLLNDKNFDAIVQATLEYMEEGIDTEDYPKVIYQKMKEEGKLEKSFLETEQAFYRKFKMICYYTTAEVWERNEERMDKEWEESCGITDDENVESVDDYSVENVWNINNENEEMSNAEYSDMKDPWNINAQEETNNTKDQFTTDERIL